MPSFKGSSKISIQPLDHINYDFKFTICSSSTANDGFLPAGRTISSVNVTGYNESGTDVTSSLIDGTAVLVVDVVTVPLKWPGTAGRYKLTFEIELDDGQIKEADFDRIFAENL